MPCSRPPAARCHLPLPLALPRPVLQVCVPQLMALVLTYPDRVTEHNIEKLKQRVLNGGFVGGQKQAPGVTLDLMTL